MGAYYGRNGALVQLQIFQVSHVCYTPKLGFPDIFLVNKWCVVHKCMVYTEKYHMQISNLQWKGTVILILKYIPYESCMSFCKAEIKWFKWLVIICDMVHSRKISVAD